MLCSALLPPWQVLATFHCGMVLCRWWAVSGFLPHIDAGIDETKESEKNFICLPTLPWSPDQWSIAVLAVLMLVSCISTHDHWSLTRMTIRFSYQLFRIGCTNLLYLRVMEATVLLETVSASEFHLCTPQSVSEVCRSSCDLMAWAVSQLEGFILVTLHISARHITSTNAVEGHLSLKLWFHILHLAYFNGIFSNTSVLETPTILCVWVWARFQRWMHFFLLLCWDHKWLSFTVLL